MADESKEKEMTPEERLVWLRERVSIGNILMLHLISSFIRIGRL
jgi:hypothetical protein